MLSVFAVRNSRRCWFTPRSVVLRRCRYSAMTPFGTAAALRESPDR
jgi:hypothetical protein